MKYRCPTAKLVGKGVVENYELQFKGMPHCSYATIAPCIGKSVPVALWELQSRDEKLLDRYEGYPSHYFKQDLPVKLNNGSELTAMVYIMNLKQNFGLPSASYYDTVSQGYKDCDFDLKVLNEAVTDSAEKFYESLEQNNLFASLTVGCVKINAVVFPTPDKMLLGFDILVKDTPESEEWICYDTLSDEIKLSPRSIEQSMFDILNREVNEYALSYTQCNFEVINGKVIK